MTIHLFTNESSLNRTCASRRWLIANTTATIAVNKQVTANATQALRQP
jgi:hypothetical protein